MNRRLNKLMRITAVAIITSIALPSIASAKPNCLELNKIKHADNTAVLQTCDAEARRQLESGNIPLSFKLRLKLVTFTFETLGETHQATQYQMSHLAAVAILAGELKVAESTLLRRLSYLVTLKAEERFGYAHTLSRLGIIEREKGNWQTAEGYFLRAIAAYDEDPSVAFKNLSKGSARATYAGVLYAKGDIKGAIKQVEAAIDLYNDPVQPQYTAIADAAWWAARYHTELGATDKAAGHLRHAIEILEVIEPDGQRLLDAQEELRALRTKPNN